MSFIEVEYCEQSGWFCNNDLILICEREMNLDDSNNFFMTDRKLQSITRNHRRSIPNVDFNDRKLFPSLSTRITRVARRNQDDELRSELDSMLSCREYVSKQNHFFDRKQFQQAQAAQAEEEKKLEEYIKRREEQRKRTRSDEKRYIRKKPSRFDH
ncbi:hypothetical protein I4U23_014908 [Adineta vaga]|nr:hypothetical protein I4U23_014908 [Adineta vaga]